MKEIWLTSEDTGTYGRDIGTSLPQLLWKLVKVIPDGCMLRIGMTNPPYILEHLQVKTFNSVVMSSFSQGYSGHFITSKSVFFPTCSSTVRIRCCSIRYEEGI